ncbi:MAG: hypothetical protein WBA29_17225, partial [Xanthobacteraceae bacterium]
TRRMGPRLRGDDVFRAANLRTKRICEQILTFGPASRCDRSRAPARHPAGIAQGSLSKIAAKAYLDDRTAEL